MLERKCNTLHKEACPHLSCAGSILYWDSWEQFSKPILTIIKTWKVGSCLLSRPISSSNRTAQHLNLPDEYTKSNRGCPYDLSYILSFQFPQMFTLPIVLKTDWNTWWAKARKDLLSYFRQQLKHIPSTYLKAVETKTETGLWPIISMPTIEYPFILIPFASPWPETFYV